jgi:apolipoprotein N-acyltransferase
VRQIHGRAWLLAIISGVLQILIFPSPSLYFLCWIALTPLLLAILRARPPESLQIIDVGEPFLLPATLWHGFVLGYACGIVWYAGTCFWIGYVMHRYGQLPQPLAGGLLVLFCLYLALYHGLFGFLLAAAARGKREGMRRALVIAPFLWIVVELARARITGFPWNLLGTAQVDNIPLAQIATVTGVYGVSFEIAIVNTAFAAAFLVGVTRRRMMGACSVLAAVALQAGVFIDPAPSPAQRTVRLVQTNIPILDNSWTFDFYQRTLSELANLSLARGTTAVRAPELIIWPESPAPFYLGDPYFQQGVISVAQKANAHVIAGSIGARQAEPARRNSEFLNSAAIITPGGDFSRRYDKIHLVPFGEYIPLKSVLVFAETLTRQVGDFGRGNERNAFDVGGYKLGVFICYESIFPDEVRQFALNGAQVFVNISNDGWFGRRGAPGQHLNMARMRAIENRRWLLRATNTGITGSIDPYGRVIARAPREIRTVLDAPFGTVSEMTLYTRYGDWFAWSCAIISLAVLFVRVRFRMGRIRIAT